MHVVSFSGGKDSTAMLLMLIEKQYPIDRVVCIDTTKEFPSMYRHIERVRALCPVPIDVLPIDYDYWFKDHVKTKGKNKGKRGYGWPDFRNRWCTALKRDTVNAYLKSLNPPGGIVQYHGIAYDERHRCAKNSDRGIDAVYPLVDWRVTENQALRYCYDRGLDWDGLYEDFERVSCWCCPLSRLSELRVMHDKYPELWSRLVDMDKLSYRQFKPTYSVADLSRKFT